MQQYSQGVSPAQCASVLKGLAPKTPWLAWIVALSAILFGLWGFAFSSRSGGESVDNQTSSSSPKPTSSNEEKKPEPAVNEFAEVTAEGILADFAGNSIKATDWYEKNKVRVRGVVDHTGNNAFGGKSTVVVLETRKRRVFDPSVEFWFDETFRSQVAELKDGQTVTLTGEFNETSFTGDVKFKGLSIVTP